MIRDSEERGQENQGSGCVCVWHVTSCELRHCEERGGGERESVV